MSTTKPSVESDDTSSTIPDPAFKADSSSTKRQPLKVINHNILGNLGGASIDFQTDDVICFNNDPDFSTFSIDDFSSQLEMNESTIFSDFIDKDPNLYGSKKFTEKMKSVSSLSPRYLKEKNGDWNRFLTAISLHPKLDILTKLVTDQHNKNHKIPYFVVLCRGGYTRPKYNILNACFIAFSLTLKKKDADI